MRSAVAKARRAGVAVVTVRRSNHFGIAGYFASIAARAGMIGIATTNASPQVAPTFGAEPMFGTNPFAVAMPTGGPADFLLDIATSTVGRGKLEVHQRRRAAIPDGWVIDSTGGYRTDVAELVEGLKTRRGYSLLPLGGAGETHGGHKGYGLALMADLLCGPLAGAAWGRHVYEASDANVGHCMIAIDVAAFTDPQRFRAESAQMSSELRAAQRAPGASRIFIPGEKEAEERAHRIHHGIPLTASVIADLEALAGTYGSRPPTYAS